MKERGILFSAPMVRALLAGTKTQTRRVYRARNPEPYEVMEYDPISGAEPWPMWTDPNRGPEWHRVECPYGVSGDRLWVRETWRPRCNDSMQVGISYRADDAFRPTVKAKLTTNPHWRPSIFMPRPLSRITLEITDVRCERLKDISTADALAEGIDCLGNPVIAYWALWDDINGHGSSATNPWVWALTFKRRSHDPS